MNPFVRSFLNSFSTHSTKQSHLGDFPIAFAFRGGVGIQPTAGAAVSMEVAGSSFNAFPTQSLVIRKEFPETFMWDVLNVIDRFVPSQS